MKDYKCAHCAHCNEIKYGGFFCDKTGYLERKRIEDKCNDFEADAIDLLAKTEFTAVRHGQWIPIEYDSFADDMPIWDKWECSECGHEHEGEEDTLTAFCPDCGAHMSTKKLCVRRKCCKYCKDRAYTKKPFIVITPTGQRIDCHFNFCPNCGADIRKGDHR